MDAKGSESNRIDPSLMQQPRLPRAHLDSIAARLRPICSHIPEAEFERLVRTVALTQWKYEQLSAEDRHRLDNALPADGKDDAESSAA